MPRQILRGARSAAFAVFVVAVNTSALSAADASKLPRLEGSTEIYASPEVVIYKAPGAVEEAAKAARTALEADGWRSFVAVGTDPSNPSSLTQQLLKKDATALSVFTVVAPAQGNATTVQYSFQPVETDLPFPNNARTIEFDGSRPELIARTTTTFAGAKDEMMSALASLGYAPVTAAEGSPSAKATTATATHAYYVKTGAKPLFLVLATQENGETLVHLRGVSEKDMLAGTMPQAAKSAEEPAEPIEDVEAEEKDEFDTLMTGILGKVKEATDKAMQGKPAEIDIDGLLGGMKPKSQAPELDASPELAAPETSRSAVSADEDVTLEVETENGLPFPKPYTAKVFTKSTFRNEVRTTVSTSPQKVLQFYRAELIKKGWKEDTVKSAAEADAASLVFDTPEGPASLSISTTPEGTSSHLIHKLPGEAQKRGVMPKPGKAMLVVSNAMEKALSVTIDGKPYKLAPLAGISKPDGPLLEVAPGTYKTSLKTGNKRPLDESVTVKADEIWGLVFDEGETLSLQLY